MKSLLSNVSNFCSPSEVSSSNKFLRLQYKIYSRIRFINKMWRIFKSTGYNDFNEQFVLDDLSILADLQCRLVSCHTISLPDSVYCDVLREFSEFPPTNREHIQRLFNYYLSYKRDFRRKERVLKDSGCSDLYLREKFINDFIQGRLDDLHLKTYRARRFEYINRMRMELRSRSQEGWFFIFNTLTVRTEDLDEVFVKSQSSSDSAWRKYIRDFDNLCAISSFGSVHKARQAKRSGVEYHKYFAVVEHGSLHGRLHIHVLHYVRNLPIGCLDPNRSKSVGVYEEIEFLKSLWSYGRSCPKALRYSSLDAFGRLGWKWPHKLKSGILVPLNAGSVDGIAFYMAKYMSKSFEEFKGDIRIWRIRLSKNLGLVLIKSKVRTLKKTILLKMLQFKVIPIKICGLRIPLTLWRRMIFRMMKFRQLAKVYSVALLRSPKTLLERLRAMIQGLPPLRYQSSGSLMMTHSERSAVSKAFGIALPTLNLQGGYFV